MRTNQVISFLGLALAVTTQVAVGQGAAVGVKDDLLQHFERSSRKMSTLSKAMPADVYTWSPGEGVMSVARVYMHIARYNYLYLESSLGIDPPADIDVANLETISDKDQVVSLLDRSIEHVRRSIAPLTERELTTTTALYGREVEAWSVLLQLVAHMNEHVGQSVAYARMNGIAPPWSRRAS